MVLDVGHEWVELEDLGAEEYLFMPPRNDTPEFIYGLHPAEINFQRPDYWIRPSMKELARDCTDKTCIVEDLTIGRKGCGQITFFGALDIFGLDIDNLGKK